MFCQECGNEVLPGESSCAACGWESAATTPMGAMPQQGNEFETVSRALADEYEITEELGRGGMAIVFRAKELALDREVAIKMLPFAFAFDADFVERFQREARTAARLEHPHIIPIYRVGRADNVIYFTMKLLRHDSLSFYITRLGALRPDKIRRLLIEAGGALGYAHKHHVVHRDVKPDNIMFHETGHSVVCDFGIAKAATESKLTGTGTAIGTPHYMSPEQARAQKVDGRSDLYSLGVVAYKCLTGRVPFDAEDSYAIGIKHITEPLPRPTFETAEHRDLFTVVERLMEKEPADRYATAEQMIHAVEQLGSISASATVIQPVEPGVVASEAEETERSAPSLDSFQTPPTPMPKSAATPEERPQDARTRRSRVPALAGALAVIVGAGGGYVVLSRNVASPAPQTVSLPEAGSDPTRADSSADAANARREPPSELGAEDPPSSVPEQPVSRVAVPGPEPEPIAEVQTPPQPADTPPATPVETPGDVEVPQPAQPDSQTMVASDTAAGATDRPAAGPREVVDSLRARAVEEGIGVLELRGLVPGQSELFIDDERKSGLRHRLPAGTHIIRVERRGYERFVREITIEAGKPMRVRVMHRRRGNR